MNYLSLARKNLTSQKTRSLLNIISISIGIGSLITLMGLSNGLQNTILQRITSNSPLTQLTVRPKANNGFLQVVSSSKNSLSAQNIEDIKKIPNIKSVTPELTYSNISSVQINILGQWFQSDSMIFGLPYEYIKSDINNDQTKWQSTSDPYPALVSRRLIDLYNFTVAPSHNLPRFDEKSFIGQELTVLPDNGTFLGGNGGNQPNPHQFKVKIVGFSDKVQLIGITVPIELVEKINKVRDPNSQNQYRELFIEVNDAENVNSVSKTIEAMDFDVTSTIKQIEQFQQNFRVVNVGLGMVSIIILLVAGLMIANTFLSAVNERIHDIGIFRAIGATKNNIRWLFLTEAGLMGLFGGILGTVEAAIVSIITNKILIEALPPTSLKPDHIVQIDAPLILLGLVTSIIISMIFALLPSNKAADLHPLRALNM